MRRHRRSGLACILALAALLSMLSGCFTKSADDLYSLPQFSDRNLQLQSLINAVLSGGAEFAAPVAGANRQAVQLEDLDGDGEKEAIAFFRTPGEERPLKVYIYRVDDAGQFREDLRIVGEGADIERITYADLNGDGGKEILVGWQISAGINLLTAYSLHSGTPVQLFSTDYTEYAVCRLTSGAGADVCVLRRGGAETDSAAELYTVVKSGEVVSSRALLSDSVASFERIRTGTLTDGRAALFVESTLQSKALVTDILIYRRERLDNITRDDTVGVSSETSRTYEVYCRDINEDGVLEVPAPVALEENGSFWLLQWYAYSGAGSRRLVMTTYHNYRDEWYLEIPAAWFGHLAIRREDLVSGERGLILSYIDREGSTEDFLTVYTLSGDNKEERARLDGRFMLAAEDDVIYAASILVDSGWDRLPISEALLRENFHILYSEWLPA